MGPKVRKDYFKNFGLFPRPEGYPYKKRKEAPKWKKMNFSAFPKFPSFPNGKEVGD